MEYIPTIAKVEGLKMLILPIKQKWFDMILHGGKKEEYREIKPYWDKRILKALGCDTMPEEKAKESLRTKEQNQGIRVCFRNGYGKNAPMFYATCSVSIKTGKAEWGAEPGTEYYVIGIKDIGVKVNCSSSDIRATMNKDRTYKKE